MGFRSLIYFSFLLLNLQTFDQLFINFLTDSVM